MDFQKLVRDAKAYANGAGLLTESEDFSQFYALTSFESNYAKPLKWALADYMRSTYGHDTFKSRGLQMTVWLDHCEEIAYEEPERGEIEVLPHDTQDEFIVAQVLLGFTFRAIAIDIGVTGAMVGVYLKKARARYEGLHLGLSLTPLEARAWVKQCYRGATWNLKKKRSHKLKAKKRK